MVFFSVLVAAAAALILLPWWLRASPENRELALEQRLLDPEVRLDEALRASGFPTRFVEVFSSVTTELVSSANDRTHIVQRRLSRHRGVDQRRQ
jgi:hypothetical protein